MTAIQPAEPADFPDILDLNRTWEHFLSPLSESRLSWLHGMSAYHQLLRDPQGVCAFILAFGPDSDYDSVNYRWFAERYEAFLYIDRIVVAGRSQGQGLGKALYHHILDHARRASIPSLACEFDVEPPNPRSQAFHESFGFREVGVQSDPNTGKQVSLQMLPTAE